MTNDLKPCPFCGSYSVAFQVGAGWMAYGGRIHCDDCGAEGVTCYSDEGDSETESLLQINQRMATDHWNERH